ncbi:MAG: ion channel [Planctomycetota bacterium]
MDKDFLKEEYKQKWEYIRHTEEQRHKFIQWYILIVGGLIAFLFKGGPTLTLFNNIDLPHTILIFLLLYSIFANLYLLVQKRNYNIYITRIAQIEKDFCDFTLSKTATILKSFGMFYLMITFIGMGIAYLLAPFISIIYVIIALALYLGFYKTLYVMGGANMIGNKDNPINQSQNNTWKTKGFAIDVWDWIFKVLRWISLFRIIEQKLLVKILGKEPVEQKYHCLFVDIWVFGHTIFIALILSFLLFHKDFFFMSVIIVYGFLRVFETVVYQINALLFDEYRAIKSGQKYAVRGYRRIVILLLQNYIEVILWFALFYLSFNASFENGVVKLNTVWQSIGFSFNTITSFGYETTLPINRIGHILTLSESAIGVFMALLVLARFISLLPAPDTKELSEK